VNVPVAEFRRLWGEFSEPSWSGWNAVEDAAFALPMDPEARELVVKVTGGRALPAAPVRELFAIVGRGGGKSRASARLAAYFACGRTYERAPGEEVYVGIFGPDRRQARITLRYVRGLLRQVPALESRVVRESESRDGGMIELEGGVVVEVLTASAAAPRGRSYALAIVEEAAFLPQDESANPDTELLRAVRPGLARVPGSLLVVVSSAYSRRGELYKAWRRHYGKDSPHHLVVQAPTEALNPTFDRAEIARAFEEDPVAAAAEYGAEFRTDVEGLIALEVIEGCLIPGRHELPPVAEMEYRAFVDPSGGGADSFALAIGHTETRDGSPVAILDALREVRPPFSPEAVVEEYAALLGTYGISEVVGDRYAGSWPAESFGRYGVEYTPAPKPKSDLYRDALALLNSARVELLDHDRLTAQLVGLERRVARGGRDSIDHAPNAHDDLSNVVAGVAVLLAASPPVPVKTYGTWGRASDRENPIRRPTPPLEVFTERGEEVYVERLADVPPEERTEAEQVLLRRDLVRRLGVSTGRGRRDHVARIIRR